MAKYYYTYIPPTKSRTRLGKQRVSRTFKTLTEARGHAMAGFRTRKLIQATFWDQSNIINHRIAGGLNTKGQQTSRRYS